MAYAVYETSSFQEEVKNLSASDQEIIHNICLKLGGNPYVGDPIRYKFFREKRINEKRIYYLVYDDLKIVLLVAIGGKKAQQETIDKIVTYFEEYRNYAKKLSDSSNLS